MLQQVNIGGNIVCQHLSIEGKTFRGGVSIEGKIFCHQVAPKNNPGTTPTKFLPTPHQPKPSQDAE